MHSRALCSASAASSAVPSGRPDLTARLQTPGCRQPVTLVLGRPRRAIETHERFFCVSIPARAIPQPDGTGGWPEGRGGAGSASSPQLAVGMVVFALSHVGDVVVLVSPGPQVVPIVGREAELASVVIVKLRCVRLISPTLVWPDGGQRSAVQLCRCY